MNGKKREEQFSSYERTMIIKNNDSSSRLLELRKKLHEICISNNEMLITTKPNAFKMSKLCWFDYNLSRFLNALTIVTKHLHSTFNCNT